MSQITIRELHMKTGAWVRQAALSGSVVVLDRSRPIARLVPYRPEPEGKSFADRPLADGFASLPRIRHDSTHYLVQDRERR